MRRLRLSFSPFIHKNNSIRKRKDPVEKTRIIEELVLGWSASPALGLKAIGSYEPVAVEGVDASKAIGRRLEEMKLRIAKGVEEGGDREGVLRSSLALISNLYESDVQARVKWMHVSLTLGLLLCVGVALIFTLGKISISMVNFLLIIPVFLSAYTLIPSPEHIAGSDDGGEAKMDLDPAKADYIASVLERGGGRIYALKGLGIYERLVVEEDLKSVVLPKWASVMKQLGDRDELAKVMRRTATLLRDLRRIRDSWRAHIRSLKGVGYVISSSLGAINVILLKVFSSPLLSPYVTPNNLTNILLISGLLTVAIATKPLGSSISSCLSYLLAFVASYYLLYIH